MAGTRQAALITVLSIAVSLSGVLASAAHSETMPLPRPAPKEGMPAPPSSIPGTGPAPSASPQSSNPFSWLDRMISGKPKTPTSDPESFDDRQRALLGKVSAYLSSVQVLTANFVQIGPDGRRATGHLYMQKPGKVRFEYDPPTPIEIVADGHLVMIRDRQLSTRDSYQLAQTPLRFLLADRIDLLRDTNVVGVSADSVYVTVVVEETQPLVGTSRLKMMFDAKDLRLKQWTVTDAQGFDTSVAVSNLASPKQLDQDLFVVDSTRLVQ